MSKDMPEFIHACWYDGVVCWEGEVPEDMQDMGLVKYTRHDLHTTTQSRLDKAEALIEVMADALKSAGRELWTCEYKDPYKEVNEALEAHKAFKDGV